MCSVVCVNLHVDVFHCCCRAVVCDWLILLRLAVWVVRTLIRLEGLLSSGTHGLCVCARALVCVFLFLLAYIILPFTQFDFRIWMDTRLHASYIATPLLATTVWVCEWMLFFVFVVCGLWRICVCLYCTYMCIVCVLVCFVF